MHKSIHFFSFDSARIKWNDLCLSLEVPAAKREKWWAEIHDSYQSVGRYYHTLAHVDSMLNHLKKYEHKILNCDEVALAIFFHE